MGLFKPDVHKMRTKEDVPGLIKALNDKDWGVRLGVFVVGVVLVGIGYLFTRLLN